jgi:hypothetical protein
MSKHRIGLRHFFKTIGKDPGLEDMHAVAKKYMVEAIAVIEKIEKKGIVLDDQHLGEVIPTLDELVKQESRIYRAALESEVSHQFIDNPAKLLLKGSRVDSVIKDLAGVLDLAPAFYECFVATNTKYPTGEALQEVIWRTSIANRTSEGRRAPEEYGRQYELLKEQLFGHVVDCLISHPVCWTCIWVFQFVKWTTDKLLWLPIVQLLRCGYFWTSLAVVLLQPELTKLVTFILIAALMATLRFVSFFVLAVALRYPALIWGLFRWSTHFSKKDITFIDPLPQGAAGYSQSLAEVRGAYKLGITSMGYICLLPLATKIGDEVAIFHGCDTPFVIRRSEPAQLYKLIGECYVHGMMQGELFENPRFSIENIAIR